MEIKNARVCHAPAASGTQLIKPHYGPTSGRLAAAIATNRANCRRILAGANSKNELTRFIKGDSLAPAERCRTGRHEENGRASSRRRDAGKNSNAPVVVRAARAKFFV
jgi:hypothetical protein